MDPKHRADLPAFPPELWLSIFHHATHVPGTLIPDVYAHVSLMGCVYTKSSKVALQDALVTKRALVRVCRQWWHLAIPYLYRSVYIRRARYLSSLATTLVRAAAGKGTLIGTQPLGEFTQRLDIAIRDRAENVGAEFDSLATLIRCMPHLAIVSFAIAPNYSTRTILPNDILDALHHSAASLRVLDWSSTQPEPSVFRIVDLLAKCTQLRVLNCPRLLWSKELQHDGIPLTVTTLHLRAITPVQIATAYNCLPPQFNLDATRCPGPSALQELMLHLNKDSGHWKDLLEVYSTQLVSVQLYISGPHAIDIQGHFQLLALLCPRLRRLTIVSDRFPFFTHPHLVFPSIAYLGLRVIQPQSPKADFETLFDLLEELRSSVPSLEVVRLTNEQSVQCLLRTHTKFVVRALRPFMEAKPFRIEDSEGVLLTGARISSVWVAGRTWTDWW